MAVPEGSGFRIVVDYRAANQLIEQAAMSISCSEELGLILEGVAAFWMLNMIRVIFTDTASRTGTRVVRRGHRVGCI